MAKTPDEILKELFDTIDTSIEKITDKADAQQKSILREVELLIKDLSLDENGNIKSTIGNLKLINKINAKLEKVILTPEYKKSVSDFVKSFTEVEELQNRYYRDVFNEFEVPKTSQELKELTIQATIKDLTESGLNSNVSNAISNLISSNIKGKQSYASLRTQLKDYILGTKEKNGRLLSYVNQITSDSLNTYSAEYDKIITDVIQPQWFKYVGSIILDSRPFCKAVVDKKWVHKSELGALSRGEVDGKQVSTQGFKPNTDKENIIINRGGWNCRHKFVAVSDEVVPDKLKEKFEDKNIVTDNEYKLAEGKDWYDNRLYKGDNNAKTLNSYTERGYQINYNIRDNMLDQYDKQYIKNLDKALNNLEIEKIQNLYRGANLNVNEFNNININSVITFDGYTSTTKNKEILGKFSTKGGVSNDKKPTIFKIISHKSGRSIEDYSYIKSEQEVLFGRNTKWKVINIEDNVVTIEEI